MFEIIGKVRKELMEASDEKIRQRGGLSPRPFINGDHLRIAHECCQR